MRRRNLALTTVTDIPSGRNNADLYRDVIRCTRALSGNTTTGCVNPGAMEEANTIRNCGVNNSACAGGGAEHDVVFFAIAIGRDTSTTDPQSSLDSNAKCLLARMANATDILHARTGVTRPFATTCSPRTGWTAIATWIWFNNGPAAAGRVSIPISKRAGSISLISTAM
jgi:hypothetical protein